MRIMNQYKITDIFIIFNNESVLNSYLLRNWGGTYCKYFLMLYMYNTKIFFLNLIIYIII